MKNSWFDLSDDEQEEILGNALFHYYGTEDDSVEGLVNLVNDFGLDEGEIVLALFESGRIPYEHFKYEPIEDVLDVKDA